MLDELGLEVPERSEIAAMLVRGKCSKKSIARYIGAARSWMRYCADRHEEPHDASTGTLLAWLDWRCRLSESPASSIRMSLAAARFVQRGRCVVLGVEALPYTPKARIQLDAFKGAATLNATIVKMARPLRIDELATLVEYVRGAPRVLRGVSDGHGELLALRDVAMLLVGWWAAFRSDDLARLRWAHVSFVVKGVELDVPASKTTSALLALARRDDAPHLCPVRALDAWYRASSNPLVVAELADDPRTFGFASGGHVGRRVKILFERAGVPTGYSAHSLRAGFATEAASQGVPDRLVQNHGRWRSVQVHASYVRSGRLWQDTPTDRIVCTATMPESSGEETESNLGDASTVGPESPATLATLE